MGASSGIGISSSMKLGLSRSAAPVGLAVTGARVRAAGPGAVEVGAARDRPGDVLWSPGFFLPYTTQQVTTMKIKPGVPAPGMRDRMGPTVGLSITTKSTLVRRDLVLLQEIAARSEIAVNFSITTLDEALARRLEPRAPRPDLRFEAMRALAAGGILTRLFIMPVLPRLTDGQTNLRALLVRAREAGAPIAESNVLFLPPRERR